MAWISDEEYTFIFNTVPRICVDMVIQEAHGKMLLTKRSIPPYEHFWHMPGGGIRFKETIAEAASRIAIKELGVDVRIVRTIGACEIMDDDLSPTDPRHSISIVLEVEIVSGEPTTTDESSAVEFFDTPPEMMHPSHQAFLTREGLLKQPY
ncbi:NUDIX domain-containing protein [Patescibacteria group bacterium]|nr:NUDIX domain-containing protein [Patescibacteria group bacterium]